MLWDEEFQHQSHTVGAKNVDVVEKRKLKLGEKAARKVADCKLQARWVGGPLAPPLQGSDLTSPSGAIQVRHQSLPERCSTSRLGMN